MAYNGSSLSSSASACHNAHESRLAKAVIADNRNLVAADYVKLKAAENIFHAIVAEAEIRASEHFNSARRRLGKTQAPGICIALGQHYALLVNLIYQLLAALRLRRLRGLRAEAVNKALKLLAVMILILLRRFKMLIAHLALGYVEVEIALIARNSPRIDLKRYIRKRAQKVAIVRDEHQRPFVCLQEFLQPLHCRKVKIV